MVPPPPLLQLLPIHTVIDNDVHESKTRTVCRAGVATWPDVEAGSATVRKNGHSLLSVGDVENHNAPTISIKDCRANGCSETAVIVFADDAEREMAWEAGASATGVEDEAVIGAGAAAGLPEAWEGAG